MKDGFFEKQVELRFCDCDYKKRARIATLMAYMADIAGVAYADKGYSHSWLWENNFVFLVSRVSISIKRMPVADECLRITTWEREMKGVLFYRDFNIKDSENRTIVEASTAWVLANPHTRQILRPSDFTGKIHQNPEYKANVTPPNRMKISEELQWVGERKIVYSDIDANGHVYNAVYLGIACDFLPEEFLVRDLADVQINFKQEAKLTQVIQMKTMVNGNTAFIVGEVDGITSFEVKMVVK